MEIVQKILEWSSGLAFVPKVLLSSIIGLVAFFLLSVLWSSSLGMQRPDNNRPKSGAVNLPPYAFSYNVLDLRAESGVKILDERQEGRRMGQLPDGVYGFSPPWMLNTDPEGVVGGTGIEKIALSAERGGTAVMEVHKSAGGNFFIIAYCSRDFATVLEDPSRKEKISIVLYFFRTEFADIAIRIPLDRIVDWSSRRSGSSSVVDSVLI
ncbi:hypothetical protein [Fulvimarina sp. MAC3]|uniref:hypothetical protein n=1 Tax=Fulvimarina sp. MAC3 TaxID=3148887 RepID=UPI0031FDE0AC